MSNQHFAMRMGVVGLVALGLLGLGCGGEPGAASEAEVSASTEALSDNPCTGLCTPTVDMGWPLGNPNFSSGNIGTGAVCRYTYNTVNGGNCGQMSGRRLSLNGVTMSCSGGNWTTAIPSARNAGWCVKVTAGSPAWSYYTLWR